MRTLLFLLLFATSAAAQESGFTDLSKQTPAQLRAQKIPYREGLLVKDGGYPRGRDDGSGIRPGDIIFKVGDARVKGEAAYREELAKAKAGVSVEVMVSRRNKSGKFDTEKVTITIGKERVADAEASIGEVRREMAAIEASHPKLAAAAAEAKAKWTLWEAEQAKIDTESRSYELKGDRLGMTLEMFKGKYFRIPKDDPRPAPYCSDAKPDQENGMLLYTPELAKAGIVHAATTFPFETLSDKSKLPTLAGVSTELMIYHFIDGKLYQITVSLDHDGYGKVMAAMVEKYGKPSSKNTKTYQNAFGATFDGDELPWTNAVSGIAVLERASKLDRSIITFQHHELSKLARDRIKAVVKPKTDDL